MTHKFFRLVLLATVVATLIAGSGGVRTVRANTTVSIVDTLGLATPTTQFNIFGSGGRGISAVQFVGPQFTLTQPTILTEIGGFVNNCSNIVSGVPQCPNTLPFTVQIRPSVSGVPDTSTVLASFVLSHDDNPLVISYESVAINLSLQAGIYFALFAPQGNDSGSLLGNASDPFVYQAGLTQMGVLDPTTGPFPSSQQFGAVRILGNLMPSAEVTIDIKPGRFPNRIKLTRNVCRDDDNLYVAILTTPSFNARTVDISSLQLGDPNLSGKATSIRSRVTDVDRDGDRDMVLTFTLCAIVTNGALNLSSTEMVLTGLTLEGVSITGRDSVKVVR